MPNSAATSATRLAASLLDMCRVSRKNWIAFSLLPRKAFTYPFPTPDWQGRITNLEIYYTPRPAASVELR